MKKPILVVMAAGMGSRYGGLKQMDPVGANGEVILDYSVFDARRAGFETVVFIIKREIEADFKARIGSRIEPHMEVRYAYQDLHDLPEGYQVPEGRVKPWGTGQAIIAGRDVIDAPFAVINADDYYGVECFRRLYDFLTQPRGAGEYCMVGYLLRNTVTDNGSVARGVCASDGAGNLTVINERTRIEKHPGGIQYTEDDGQSGVEHEHVGLPARAGGGAPAALPRLFGPGPGGEPHEGGVPAAQRGAGPALRGQGHREGAVQSGQMVWRHLSGGQALCGAGHGGQGGPGDLSHPAVEIKRKNARPAAAQASRGARFYRVDGMGLGICPR